MPKSPTKNQVRVEVKIKPVKLSEITLAQRASLAKFWKRLIAEAKGEAKK